MTRIYNIEKTAALVLTLILSFSVTDISAKARRGYALWCSSNTTLYFVQADARPDTYDRNTIDYAWEITDENLSNGVAAPVWIRTTPNSAVGTIKVPQQVTTVVIDHSFRFVVPAGFYSWFHGCVNLTTVRGLCNLNTSRAGYMNKMFYGCTSLETIDFTGIDMKPIINTTMMFYGCNSLHTIYADEAWTPPYSAYMFTGCEQLPGYASSKVDASMANGDDGYFNIDSNIYALCLKGVGNPDDYLYFVRTPKTIAENDEYDGKSVRIVYGYDNFKEVYPDGHFTWAWNGNTLIRHVVFEPSFRNVHLPTLERFLKGYSNGSITDIDGLEYLNTSEVTSMRSMFEGCVGLTSLDVSSLDMSSVQDIGCMFKGCSNVTSINLSGVNTSNVTDMEYLFAGCSKLQSLDLSSLDTRRVTRMNHLFEGCRSLNALDVSKFNTSSVTDMEAMFAGCYLQGYYVNTGLQELDVNAFDMTNVTNTKEMFLNCGGLKTIYCDNTWNVPASEDMFKGCTSLSAHISYDPDKVDGTYANPHTGYFYSELYPPTYDPQGRFIISDVAKWEEFAELVNNGETNLSAVMIKDVDLGNSQVKVGTDEHPYAGTFEGNGHKLNIAYVSEGNNCAPFSEVNGCTITNLHVTGSIQANHTGAGGLIGQATQSGSTITITKCWSSVTINSTIEGGGYIGGFIGENYESKFEITNCLFDGEIIGKNTYGCGGFFGYIRYDDAKSLVTITYSLMNATTIDFKTEYVSPLASGPFYGFYKRATSEKTYFTYVKVNSSGYTKSFGFTTLQGTDLTNTTDANEIIRMIVGSNSEHWCVVDGKPALKY